MSDHKSTLTAILVDGVSGPARQIKAEITGISASAATVAGAFATVGSEIAKLGFEALSEAVTHLSDIIPNLIQQGNDWLKTLRDIQLETGLTAEQTSALAGVAQDYGVSAQQLVPILSRLGLHVAGNEAAFRQFGIATRDAKGNLLDTWTMLQQVREAVVAHGQSLETTGVITKLFGRNAIDLIPILSLTDAQFKAATDSVDRFGGIVSQSAIDGAEKFKRGLDTLRQGVVDIGTQIAAALDPYLEQFIANFTVFVQQHLNDIINFFVTVANAVIGFVSGLFGITNAVTGVSAALDTTNGKTQDWTKTQEAAQKQHDAFTNSLNNQIKAIDAQSAALTRQEQARHASRQREQLAQSLSDAERQLADLRGNAPFTSGLSAAEQQLALQKHSQDIIDAEKNVADKRKALGDFELDQRDQAEQELLRREKARAQDRLKTETATFNTLKTQGLELAAGLTDKVGGAVNKTILDTQRFGASAKEAFDAGTAAANSFLDIIVGNKVSLGVEGTYRTGGVIGALGAVGDVFQLLFNNLNIIIPAIFGLLVAKTAVSLIGMLGTFAVAIGPQGVLMLAIAASIGGIVGFVSWLNSQPLSPAAQIRANAPPGTRHGPGGSAAGGWVGQYGPELRMVGEEGPEYVIPNHELGTFGRGGTQIIVHNHFDFISMPSRQQLRDLADAIDEIFQMKADNGPVGLQAFTGATG